MDKLRFLGPLLLTLENCKLLRFRLLKRKKMETFVLRELSSTATLRIVNYLVLTGELSIPIVFVTLEID